MISASLIPPFLLLYALIGQGQHNTKLRDRASAILDQERARAKRTSICPDAMDTLSINQCMAGELKTTDGNYVKFIRILGAQLRGEDDEADPGHITRIPFDDAEDAWKIYRVKACFAVGDLNRGGTIRPMEEMGCRIDLTLKHMEELWSSYEDVGR